MAGLAAQRVRPATGLVERALEPCPAGLGDRAAIGLVERALEPCPTGLGDRAALGLVLCVAGVSRGLFPAGLEGDPGVIGSWL